MPNSGAHTRHGQIERKKFFHAMYNLPVRKGERNKKKQQQQQQNKHSWKIKMKLTLYIKVEENKTRIKISGFYN